MLSTGCGPPRGNCARRSAVSASAGVRPRNAFGIDTPLALLMIRKYSSVVCRSPATRFSHRLNVVSKHQLRGIRVEIQLAAKVRLLMFARVMAEEDDGHYQWHESLVVLPDYLQ
jgi:hypothetical protein